MVPGDTHPGEGAGTSRRPPRGEVEGGLPPMALAPRRPGLTDPGPAAPPHLLRTVHPVPLSGGPIPALPQVPGPGSHSPRVCGPPPGCHSPAGGAGPAEPAAARGPAAHSASAQPAAAASGLQGQVQVRPSAFQSLSHRQGPGSMPTSGAACGHPVPMPVPQAPVSFVEGELLHPERWGGSPSSPSTGLPGAFGRWS